MKIFSTYSVKIKDYNHIFDETVSIYRKVVDYFINVCVCEWENVSKIDSNHYKQQYIESLCHMTKDNYNVKYHSFDKKFYKFPSYLRRGAIVEAIGKVSSYKSNLSRWESAEPKTRGKKPSYPKAGYVYPCMYRTVMYEKTGPYEAKIKVFIRNTWDWLTVQLRKSDVDYITRRSAQGEICAPTLQKRGHEWFLDYPLEEYATLSDTNIFKQTIVAVDLGINSAAAISVMHSDGTVIGRKILKLPKEYDSLNHSMNRIKKAQQNGNRHTPRLWAKANGINDRISVETACWIIDVATEYKADVIVFEHLDTKGKKSGSKKQILHMWRHRYVQSMVAHKAHLLGMRISRVNAKGTSMYAYDGSGVVLRGKEAKLKSYSLCKFQTGKCYNCDLSASYNIGSRYYIREILKSLPARERLELEAKVPQVTKRTTCTLSTLINLNAGLSTMVS